MGKIVLFIVIFLLGVLCGNRLTLLRQDKSREGDEEKGPPPLNGDAPFRDDDLN